MGYYQYSIAVVAAGQTVAKSEAHLDAVQALPTLKQVAVVD
ncbi:MAG: hypothetical protein ACKO96_14810 [Flammeovirgaceae bacterium]